MSKTNIVTSHKVGAMGKQDQHLTHPPAILIVDDDSPTLELYAGVLGRHYRIFVCANPAAALEILSVESLQLVVLEPSVAGSECWTFVERLSETYAIPIIVCSALDDRKAGMKAGATAYLVKPVLPSKLLDLSKTLLNQLH